MNSQAQAGVMACVRWNDVLGVNDYRGKHGSLLNIMLFVLGGIGRLDLLAGIKMTRILCQFSCGAASAVATKLAIAQNTGKLPLLVLNAYIENEHPDNRRFAKDCERWFGVPLTVLRDERYGADIIKVFRQRGYMKGPRGAPCTTNLKRNLLKTVEQPGDIIILGFDASEADRWDDFQERNPDRPARAPLIEMGLDKQDCKAMVERAGIALPAMYLQGYDNANCIGCVKGGEGYFRAIREDYPEQFETLCKLFARQDSNYKALPGCDVWDAARDARMWPGGGPVVAHPPCRAWGRLRHFARPRPDEKELGLWAAGQVRKWGGVLEHPAGSTLWDAAGLPKPGRRDQWGGWTLAAPQKWWGHKAEKATWFYVVGCAPGDVPALPYVMGEAAYVVQSRKRSDYRPHITKAEREHTPPELAEWLVELARRCMTSNA